MRESPTLILMARLIDAGYDVVAYDESLAIFRNVASQAEYLAKAAPQLASVLDKLMDVLVDDGDDLLEASDVLVVSHSTDAFRNVVARREPHQRVIDLVRLDREINERPSYQGICW